MAKFWCIWLLLFFLNPRFLLSFAVDDDESDHFILFHQDYSPPSPPPPPPRPPTVSCEGDLDGVGSLDTTCQIVSDLNLTDSVYIQGTGNFFILPNVKVNCFSVPGCEITINVTGNFSLGENSSIIAGTFELAAWNATLNTGSVINTTSLAGDPPAQTSGTPHGLDRGGRGYGGRGACCLMNDSKWPKDVWGGDAYS